MAATLSWVVLLSTGSPSISVGQAASNNRPPAVSIGWPHVGDAFSAGAGLGIKIKANATDSDGTVSQVQFFAETNLIGVVTNPPFNVIWEVGVHPGYDTWSLKAVAVDNLGARSESVPVEVYYYTGGPPLPVLEVNSPRDGELFVAPATFFFAAEGLAGLGDTRAVGFFVGTDFVWV